MVHLFFLMFQLLLVTSLISGFNFQRPNRHWIVGYAVRVMAAFLISGGYALVMLPPLVGPFGGSLVLTGFVLVVRILKAAVVGFANSESYDNESEDATNQSMRSGLGSAGFFLLSLVLAFGSWAATGPMFNTKHYVRMLGEVGQTRLADAKNTSIIPLVGLGQVAQKADDPIAGDGASLFKVRPEQATAQLVGSGPKTRFIYAVPSDFADPLSFWRNRDVGTLGWVSVDANRPNDPAVLVGSERFRYTPGAFLDRDLLRHVYLAGYQRFYLEDVTLEVDEAGKAWWTITALRPTAGWGARDVVGVVLVDPVSGNIQFAPKGNIPSWIDRVYPLDVIHERIQWAFGLKNGYFTFGNRLGLRQPVAASPQELDLTVGANGGQFAWTGLTSTSNADQAISGIIRIDLRTGKAHNVSLPVPSAPSESKVGARMRAAIKGQPGRELDVESPTLFEVDGQPAYISAVTTESVFQGVMVYHFQREGIFGYAASLDGALSSYRLALAQAPSAGILGGGGAVQRFTFDIARRSQFCQEGDTVFILDDGKGRIFSAMGKRLSGFSRNVIALSREGDRVRVSGTSMGAAGGAEFVINEVTRVR